MSLKLHMRPHGGPQPRALSKLLLFSAASAVLLVAAVPGSKAHAQDQGGQASDTQPGTKTGKKTVKKKSDGDITTIVVTGTHISGVKPVGSETTSLNHNQIVATGLSNITDVVKTLPQVQNLGVLREGSTAGYGGNSTQGTAINLRGIGTSATLTLVDGHRLAPSGAASAFTESTQLPIAAIERVEIVSDGASAIYGSDAVSGVVNYVVRKHYDGTEVGVRYRSTFGNYDVGGSVTTGHSWPSLWSMGQGNYILSYDQEYRTRLQSYKSPWLARDLTRFGGKDNTINGNTATIPGIPGNIVVTNADGSYTYYGVPAGDNSHLTAAELLSTPNTSDPALYSDYVGEMRRRQAVLVLNQDITDWLSVSYEGFYTQRNTVTNSYPNNAANVSLPASSPYYVSGITGVAPGAAETVQYNFAKDLGAQSISNPDLTWTQTLSFNANMPGDWKMDGFATFGRDATCGICNVGNNLNFDAFQAEVNNGDINPFSSTPLSATETAKFLGTNIQLAQNKMRDVGLKFAGPLFSLPAGKVRMAIGAESQYNQLSLQNGANRGVNNVFNWDNTPTSHRTVDSAYAEIYVPVIGEANSLPLVKALNIDLAARYDDYSDFGGTTNPKIGLTWDVTEDFSLLASWGHSFRAPTLNDTNTDVYSVAYVNPFTANNSGDSAIKQSFAPGFTGALNFLGANPDLKPETAKTWSAGFDYKPHQITGLAIGGSYYNIHYDNQIVFSPPTQLFLASPQYRQLYAKYITPIDNTGCVEGDSSTYDPKLKPWLAMHFLYGGYSGSVCQINVVIDGREANLASTFQDGVDLHWNYFRPTPLGMFTTGGAITKILNATQTPVEGAPAIKAYNRIYSPVGLRARLTFGLTHGRFNTNLYVNHTGSYLNNLTISDTVNGVAVQRPYQRVPAYTTFDLGIAYIVPKDAGESWLRGLRASVTFQNLLDKDPPVVLNGTSAYDAANADIYGRTTMLQLSKSF